jgi:hypothetical protein
VSALSALSAASGLESDLRDFLGGGESVASRSRFIVVRGRTDGMVMDWRRN